MNHDTFCPPGLGKPDPDRCPHCVTVRAIRADERRRIRAEIEQEETWQASHSSSD